jgi:hypothetical protein
MTNTAVPIVVLRITRAASSRPSRPQIRLARLLVDAMLSFAMGKPPVAWYPVPSVGAYRTGAKYDRLDLTLQTHQDVRNPEFRIDPK